MERNVDVTTGESVVFSYELAGLGSRFYAVAIDIAIQIAVVLVAFALLAWVASGVRPAVAAEPVTKLELAIVVAALSIAGFLIFFGYFILFEWRFGGRTPGKRLLGIRVVRDGGFPLDFTSAVVRNVVRILELALGFYALSAIATLTSPTNRRLGDMAAGTIVVRDGRYERLDTLARGSLDTAARARSGDAVVAELSASERDLVRRYVARRPTLTRASQAVVAAEIAGVVRPRLAIPFTHLGDDDLLVHLAATALGET